MDGYRLGKTAKFAFFATLLLIVGLRACGDSALRTADEGAALLRESAESVRDLAATGKRIAGELVAEHADPKTAADATLRILEIVEALDKAELAATLDSTKAALYDATLETAVRDRDLRQLCDGAARPANAAPPVPIAADVAQRLQAAGFTATSRRDRERYLGDVAVFRKQLSICLWRDVARELASGSEASAVDALVADYQARDERRPIDVEKIRALFSERDQRIAELAASSGSDASSARTTVLQDYRRAIVDLYPDLDEVPGAATAE